MILLYTGYSGSAFDFLNGVNGYDGFFKQLVNFLKAFQIPIIGISLWSFFIGMLCFSVLGVVLNRILDSGIISSSEIGGLRTRASRDKVKKRSPND